MPQSLSLVIVHIVFSTKDRTPNLSDELLPQLHAYLATVARNSKCDAIRVGGIADHVHLAVRLARTEKIADLVEELKTASSKWLKSQAPHLREFAWQRGYGAFSVGYRDLDALVSYIEHQSDHHRKRTFQEEYMEFLNENGIEPDPRYVWD